MSLTMLENGNLVFVRGIHPNEVSAFSLAIDVAKFLRQRGYDVSLETLPYSYSLNYLADHEPGVILKYCRFMKTTRYEKARRREFEEELRRADPSGDFSEIWEWNLSHRLPQPAIRKLREEYKGSPIIEFHNRRALRSGHRFSDIFSDDINPSTDEAIFFTVDDGHYGIISKDAKIENCYFLEIPSFYRRVPREVLIRRKKVFGAVKGSFEHPHAFLDYLEYVVDFKKSQRRGLTGQKMVEKLAEAIEEMVTKNGKK